MGTKAREIVGKDVKKIVALLNQALADEWLAYYQYWIGAKIGHGPMRQIVTDEFEVHATEELKHAGMLVERIIQLGGVPVLEPKEWYERTHCGYAAPNNPSIAVLLKQNVKSEQCAIGFYQKLADACRDADEITYYLALAIMKDEVSHEEDLEAYLKDLAQK
ncbi:MAG: Ferritin, Dps family protein [Parachlamydiales bacterium]|nr:Ferritin, Dps family protein [Parachlamydiales bacterium]